MNSRGLRAILLGLAVVSCAIAVASPSVAAGQKLVVVVANRLVLSDLDNPKLHTISTLIRNGAVGLVSANCAGPNTEPAAFLTASAGAPSRGGYWVAECYQAGEQIKNDQRASAAFAARTGHDATPPNGVFLGVAQSIRENEDNFVTATVGLLGQAVHRAGKRTAAIGNADCPPETVDRSAAVLASDDRGLIDYADFSDVTSAAPSAGGLLSDPAKLADRTVAALSRADLVVVDFGDTRRLDNLKISISADAYESQKAAALRGLDALLERVARVQGASIVLVSLAPPLESRWTQLTPIVAYAPGYRGLLTSSTTRTNGLIAAGDFTATALRLMGLSSAGALEHEASSVRASRTMDQAAVLSEHVTTIRLLEVPVLWFITLVGVVAFTVTSVLIAFRIKAGARVWRWLRIAMLIPAAGPLAMLVAAAAPSIAGCLAVFAVSIVVFVPLALAAGKWTGRRAGPVLVLYGLTGAAVIIDALLGCPLEKFSIPSSFQLSGDRYYGIGNEYAGILITMAAVTVLLLGNRIRTRVVGAVGAVLVFVLGYGALGANYGGAIAAVSTFVLIWLSVFRGGFRARSVVFSVVAGVAVAGVLAFVDWQVNGPTGTHGGRMAELVSGSGVSFAFSIIARKVLMNLRLMATTTAQKAFLCFVPFIALWIWGIRDKIRAMLADDKQAVAGFKALAIGAAVGFLFNDSGVVMAGIILSMFLLALLYSLIERAEKGCLES